MASATRPVREATPSAAPSAPLPSRPLSRERGDTPLRVSDGTTMDSHLLPFILAGLCLLALSLFIGGTLAVCSLLVGAALGGIHCHLRGPYRGP